MSPIAPPAIPPVAPPTAASAGPHVTVDDPSAQLTRLPLGTRLAATVLGQTPDGTVQVATTAGLLRLPPSPRLPREGTVTLIVHTLAPKLTLQIAPAPATSPQPTPPPVVVGSAATPAPPLSATVGQPLTVTVVKGAASTATAGPGAAAGAPLQLREGQTFPGRIVSITPASGPGTSVAGAAAKSSPATGAESLVRGTVTGTAANGQAIVNTASGVLVLPVAGKPILGASLTLAIQPPAPEALAATTAAAGGDGVVRGMAALWPSLTQALDTLNAADPHIAQQAAERVLAKPDGGFAAKALFLLSALRGGELAGWFGQKPLEVLRAANPALAARFAEDFRQWGRGLDEPTGGDWRTALIPIAVDGAIEPVRLLHRHHRRDDGTEGDGSRDETRFVVDVSLSRLGRLQLDGLVREHGRHMDLIVRTERPLPRPMRDDIWALFRDAAEAVGFSGGLVFRADSSFVYTRSTARTAGGRASIVA